jgi:thioredoxin-like negative regulator of GroEL
MRNNAGENRSQELEECIKSKDVQSRYSAAYEQWQDGQPETTIRTLTRLVRSMKTESDVNVRFWFHMLMAATNASNVHRSQDGIWGKEGPLQALNILMQGYHVP